MKQHRSLRFCRIAALIPLLAALTGCGESNPFNTRPISGKITSEDGTPIDAPTVIVHFIPDRDGAVGDKYPQPAQATLTADGTFAHAGTFAKDDGAILGRHKVVLETMNGNFSPRPGAVAKQFTDPSQTPLSVEVLPEGNNHFELTVTRGP